MRCVEEPWNDVTVFVIPRKALSILELFDSVSVKRKMRDQLERST